VTHRIHHCAGGILTLTIALSTIAAPASARTFDFNATGSMIQQPLPPEFACAMRRAITDRRIPCKGIYEPAKVAATRVPARFAAPALTRPA
jgi:hypothetical protein